MNTETGAAAISATAPVTTTNQVLERLKCVAIKLLNFNVEKFNVLVGTKLVWKSNPGFRTKPGLRGFGGILGAVLDEASSLAFLSLR